MFNKNKNSRSSSADPKPLLSQDALAQNANEELKKITPAILDNHEYYTVDDAISQIGNGTFQWRLMVLTGGIWAADAMEMMLLSFIMPILKDEWDLPKGLDGAISAIVFAGMLCGVAFWSVLADHIGRKKVVVLSNLGCAIFGVASGLSPNIYFMLTARFFVGFSVGGSGCAYTLFAEYAPQEIRGALLVIEQSWWSIGAIFSVCLAWISLIYLSWRWYMILSSIPLFIISLFSKWMPESSRWLLAAGRVEEAEKELKYVAKVNGNKKLPSGKLKPVKTSGRGNPLDAFKPRYRRTTILLYITFFVCVFGYYGICFISVKFFEEAEGDNSDNDIVVDSSTMYPLTTFTPITTIPGWKQDSTYWESLIAASSELPALLIGVYILDRIGRKNTLLGSFGIFSVCSFLLLIPFIQDSIALGVSCVFFARLSIALGFMAIYIYFSEYYPTAIRSTSLGMASALGRVAGMLTSFVSEDLRFEDGMLMYAVAGVVAFICTYLLKTDTLGREMATSVSSAPPEWLKNNFKQSLDLDVDENYDENLEMHHVKKTMSIDNNDTPNTITNM